MGRTRFTSFLAFYPSFGIFNIDLNMSDTQQIDGLLARVAGDVEALREYYGRNGGVCYQISHLTRHLHL